MTDKIRDDTARRLGVPIYSLLGGKVRNKVAVYAWIGGDRPGDVEAQALVSSSPIGSLTLLCFSTIFLLLTLSHCDIVV